MKKRGKVLRVPNSGLGLLMIDGQQFRFSLDTWRSEISPTPGMNVEAEIEDILQVTGIAVIPAPQNTQTRLPDPDESSRFRRKFLVKLSALAFIAMAFFVAGWFLLRK